MMRERILELALAASGGGEAERALLEPLCAAAEAAWLGRLREGVTAADCGEALPCAAALTAAADLAAAGGVASFSAGDISVNLGGGDRAGRAACLRQAAEGLMEPFVRAAGLWAQGVEG
nr:hypothetical protein [uncultured Oscillibacter sp.]